MLLSVIRKLACAIGLSTACFAQTVVGFGDSLTEGAGGTSWTKQLTEMTGLTTVNRGVGGNTSTQILERMLAEPDFLDDYVVIWAGRNDYYLPDTVISNVAKMVGSLTTDKYIVLGIINGAYPTESEGLSGWRVINRINASFAQTYGFHYIDIRSILVNSYDPNNAQDVADHGIDLIPSSLRSDVIHLNTAGYKIVAQAIAAAVVPEPATVSLMMVAAPALVVWTCRRRRAGKRLLRVFCRDLHGDHDSCGITL